MVLAVNLSCDLGEAVTTGEIENERAIWPLVHAANVACGGHTGDQASMAVAVELCRRHRVILGAHPSYPDRKNFGRRSMKLSHGELKDSLLSQMNSLRLAASEGGLKIERIKPHGALYNDAYRDDEIAMSILDAVLEFDRSASVVCQDGSALSILVSERGSPAVLEAFADRRYQPDGTLVARTDPKALLLDLDEAAEQAWSLVERGLVRARTGEQVKVRFETLVIHSDMQESLARLIGIRRRLTAEGVALDQQK